MSQVQESMCTMLIHFDGASPPQKELKEALEKGNIETKIENMKKIIMLQLNGESQAGLLMTVIRFVLPSDDHTLKKLLLNYFEIIDKTDSQGRLLPEMILVCNFIRNDLQHPNEYIRGCTLRFICKVKEEELIEPLTDSILQNLEHRHSYVRRNAVLAVFSVFQRFPRLLPDAPEVVERFLDSETDISAKRNAFIMLFNCAQDRAVRYLRKAIDLDITSTGDIFQLALVDLLKHLCKTNTAEKSQYLRVIFSLLASKSPSVLFQCANTLLTLSASPTAVRESAATFVNLLNTHGDNNVKLIVLDRLEEIKKRFPEVLADLQMDLLRSLGSPNMDIRKKVLELSLVLVTPKTVEKVVHFLKKEVVKSRGDSDTDRQQAQEYRQMLVRAIHQCTVKHPQVASMIVPVLLDYVMEPSSAAVDVILFIREVMEKQPTLREEVLSKLCGLFPTIGSPRVLRITLWIFGVHALSVEEIHHVFSVLRGSLGAFPLVPQQRETTPTTNRGKQHGESDDPDADAAAGHGSSSGAGSGSVSTSSVTTRTAGTAVREDGTYVTTLVDNSLGGVALAPNGEAPFKTLLVGGDFFLASVLSNTLSKLFLRLAALPTASSQDKHQLRHNVAEVVNELLALGHACRPSIDDDSHERIRLSLQLLSAPDSPLARNLLSDSITAFVALIQAADRDNGQAQAAERKAVVPVDQPLGFTQLARGRRAGGGGGAADDGGVSVEDVSLATANQSLNQKSDFISQLHRVMQLTGFSDPVYAEATVTVHQFDILLDLLIVNQTNETMQNLTVELATVGDLKLCERPQNYTVAPREQISIKANIKVSSTETGIIFGNIVYDTTSAASERNCVILNDIHIDIMDYIQPASCPATQFRSMWAEFEWENKVAVNTEIKHLREYLDHLIKHTNMKCLTADSCLEGDCDFLSANLYAKSTFGEDALANISIERGPDGKIEGFVRIRSKTQGIALSLGDKITMKQKG